MRGFISEENVHSQVLIYTTCNGDFNRTDASQYSATVIGCPNCLHLHSHFCSQLLPSRSRPVQNPYPGVYGPRIDRKAPRRPEELSERRMMGLIRIFSGEHAPRHFMYGVQSYQPLYRYRPSLHQHNWQYQLLHSWLPPLLPTHPVTHGVLLIEIG